MSEPRLILRQTVPASAEKIHSREVSLAIERLIEATKRSGVRGAAIVEVELETTARGTTVVARIYAPPESAPPARPGTLRRAIE